MENQDLKNEFDKPKNQLTFEMMAQIAAVKSMLADIYTETQGISMSKFNSLYEDRLKEKRGLFKTMMDGLTNNKKSGPQGG